MFSSNHFMSFLPEIIISLPAIVVVSIVTFLICLNYFTAPRYTSLEPPPLPHYQPFFGHALSFVRDQRAFFEWANKKTKGRPFSMLMAGDKLYVFHRPDDISLIFRKSSTLRETRTDQKNFRINILGFDEHDAAKVADLREHERQIHTGYLLAAEPLELMLTRYFEELDGQFFNLQAEIERVGNGNGVEKNCFSLVGDLLMRPTVQTLFGPDTFVEYPDLFRDFRQFLSEHFFERMIGLPNIFGRNAVRARERIKKHLAAVLKSIDGREGVSGYIQDRVKKLGTLGLSSEGILSNEFDIILGSNLNSIPIAYLTLLHLIVPSPEEFSALPSILSELKQSNWTHISPASRANLSSSTANHPHLPRLHALVHEVLRYHTTAWSAREVTQTTLLSLKPSHSPCPPTDSVPRTYELRPGAIIAMPSSLLHHDPSIHMFPSAFDARRFLPKDLGGRGTPVSSATLRPFGGGSSYCPGRRFAVRQVVGFVAEVMSRFEIQVVGRGNIPRNADFFYVTRQRDVRVVVRRRKGI